MLSTRQPVYLGWRSQEKLNTLAGLPPSGAYQTPAERLAFSLKKTAAPTPSTAVATPHRATPDGAPTRTPWPCVSFL